jgi:predicted esterase
MNLEGTEDSASRFAAYVGELTSVIGHADRASRAPLLSSRGKVLEHGMPRLFRRLTEGVFDEEDVRARRTSWPFFELRARRMASRCRSRSAIPTGKHRGMA